jgi:hemerythrin-like domain-containing protein
LANSKRMAATDTTALEFKNQAATFSGRRSKKNGTGQLDSALDGVIETLYSEHGHFLSLLDTLEQETEKLKPAKIPDYHLLLEIVDYLTHYPDQYHHPREDLLFAKMLSVDKGFKTDLERLEREHKTLRTYNDKLFGELKRIAAGRRVDRPELKRNLTRYINGYRQHIEFESKKIFPKAKGELSSADLKKLQAKTRYIDDPLFGSAVETQYRRLGRNVQAGVGSLAADLLSREITSIETAIDGASGVVAKVRSLRNGLAQVNKVAFERNKTTVRQHLGREDEVSALQLPNALFRNHQQYMKDSFEQVKTIFSDRTTDH